MQWSAHARDRFTRNNSASSPSAPFRRGVTGRGRSRIQDAASLYKSTLACRWAPRQWRAAATDT